MAPAELVILKVRVLSFPAGREHSAAERVDLEVLVWMLPAGREAPCCWVLAPRIALEAP